MSDVPITPAASVVLVRRGGAGRVLMGQRGAGAVFMPSKYVFPGGRVDSGDHSDTVSLSSACQARLGQHLLPTSPPPAALVACVRRELHEETSLSLPPTAPLRFIFRAITPPGSPRRFDSRFFLADANHIEGALDDFSGAEDELSHLHWVALDETRTLDLPFITEIVLAELRALLAGHDQQGVPFFDNSGPVPTFRRIT
jgi:8-oxo-dGTP pyrophosphatase MutT (NUDIX family)